MTATFITTDHVSVVGNTFGSNTFELGRAVR